MVPDYLKSVADRIIEKKNTTNFRLKCLCGNNTFLTAKNKADEKENSQFGKYWKSIKLPIFSYSTATDKNGKRYVYGSTFFGIRIGKFYIDQFSNDDVPRIIKAKCDKCGREFIIFHSQHNGYNALTEEQKVSNDMLEFSYTEKPAEIYIEVRTDLSYDEFVDEFGPDKVKYSNTFGDIVIYSFDGGRKKKFFEEETS